MGVCRASRSKWMIVVLDFKWLSWIVKQHGSMRRALQSQCVCFSEVFFFCLVYVTKKLVTRIVSSIIGQQWWHSTVFRVKDVNLELVPVSSPGTPACSGLIVCSGLVSVENADLQPPQTALCPWGHDAPLLWRLGQIHPASCQHQQNLKCILTLLIDTYHLWLCKYVYVYLCVSVWGKSVNL